MASTCANVPIVTKTRLVYTSEFLKQFDKCCTVTNTTLDEKDKTLTICNKIKISSDLKDLARCHHRKIELVEAKFTVSENAWSPAKHREANNNPKRVTIGQIRLNLNKVSTADPKTLLKLIEKIIADVNMEYVEEIVALIVEKAIEDISSQSAINMKKSAEDKKAKSKDPVNFCLIYAKICIELVKKFKKEFGKALLRRCQLEFEKVPPIKTDDLEEYNFELDRWNAHRRGSIRFISELVNVGIASSKIVLACLYRLLNHDVTSPIPVNVNHAGELILLVKKKMLDQETIDLANRRFTEFFLAGKLVPREKFKVEDVLKELTL